jgi:RNA polymerase sigma-70 factor (ECF subfamily)
MTEPIGKDLIEQARPYERALRVHCYRMLGSSSDSEDMVQETLLRAWRSRDTLTSPEMLRPWLYRIATNVCLDELAKRPKRGLILEGERPLENPTAPLGAPLSEDLFIEPAPDAWIEGATQDPGARYSAHEGIVLAFVAALQVLTPIQRATLLLRDVVGLSADETKDALDVSLGAANSALFRAREVVETKLGGREQIAKERAAEVDRELLARYVRAFEEANVDELVGLLHADVECRMPPRPTWVLGSAKTEAFFRHMFAVWHGTIGLPRLVPTRGNGMPAFGYYRSATRGAPLTLHAIQIVELRGREITAIDHFMLPRVLPVFGLPRDLA